MQPRRSIAPRIAVAHIHKTAGTTLSGVFKAAFGGHYCLVEATDPDAECFSAEDLRDLQRIYPRLEAVMGHPIRPHGDLHEAAPGLSYLTFLREPLARCASHYQYDVQRGGVEIPFEEWITHDVSPNRQTRHLAGPGATAADAIRIVEDRVDFVGLTEQFDASLVMMAAFFGLPWIGYVRKWSAPTDDIKRRLLEDPRTRGMIEDANREDLALYRHVVEEVFPRQEAAYGPTLAADTDRFAEDNRGLTLRRMTLRPRYLRYVVKWRLAYRPWVERRRRARTAETV